MVNDLLQQLKFIMTTSIIGNLSVNKTLTYNLLFPVDTTPKE